MSDTYKQNKSAFDDMDDAEITQDQKQKGSKGGQSGEDEAFADTEIEDPKWDQNDVGKSLSASYIDDWAERYDDF